MTGDKPEPCILETVDNEGTYSCFVRDYDLRCPFATFKGLEMYSCRSGRGIKAQPIAAPVPVYSITPKSKEEIENDEMLQRAYERGFEDGTAKERKRFADLNHISEERRGCLTCLNPDCPIWQAADQKCWKHSGEPDCNTCPLPLWKRPGYDYDPECSCKNCVEYRKSKQEQKPNGDRIRYIQFTDRMVKLPEEQKTARTENGDGSQTTDNKSGSS